MTLDKLLAQMRQQHEELGIAIRVFDSMTNGHHHKKRLSVMERAAQMIHSTHGEEGSASGNGHRKMRKSYKRDKKRDHETYKARIERERAQVAPPLTASEQKLIAGAVNKGMKLSEALRAALAASPRPLFSTELGPILNKQGVRTEKGHNPIGNKAVGVLAAAFARRGEHNVVRTEDNRFWISK